MDAFLSYSNEDKPQATVLYEHLSQYDDIAITWDAIDLAPRYESPNSFVESVRGHDAVVHLISYSFLTSVNCMRELLAFMKDDSGRNRYAARTVPVIIGEPGPSLDLFKTAGQLRLVEHWRSEKVELEKALASTDQDFPAAAAELRQDLIEIREIGEHIVRFMRTVANSVFAMSYEEQLKDSFSSVVTRLREIGADESTQIPDARQTPPAATLTTKLASARQVAASESSPSTNPKRLKQLKHLTELASSIVIASENDPSHPEFPPFSPRFPATPAYDITIPHLGPHPGRKAMVKDESHNPTGTHKDRMAWEIVAWYKTIIEDLLSPHAKTAEPPAASIISNGSAALAIQVMLKLFGLPSLRVLMDKGTDAQIVRKLRRVGALVTLSDLSAAELDSAAVLKATDNEGGFDLTARNLIDPNRRTYYDWLAYEILNCEARHVFIPVGTGDLYVNVLTVLREELLGVTYDARLKIADPSAIEGMQIYGATSSNQKTRMDKLYAKYRPTLAEAKRVVLEMVEEGLCGEESRVYDVGEKAADEALRIAAEHGVKTDESGIAGLSLLLQLGYRRTFPADERVLIVNTGWFSLP